MGDFVLSCDLESDGICQAGRVQKVIRTAANRLYDITFAGKTLRATENHPIYVANKQEWVAAKDLDRGDQLVNLSNELIFIEDIQVEEGEFTVYNLDVEHHHNYYACDILVHNCNALAALPALPLIGAIAEGGVLAEGAALAGAGAAAIGAAPAAAFVGSAAAIGYALHKATEPSAGDGDSAGVETGTKPPNLAPEGAGRKGAFNKAKENNGIPTSQQPDEVLPNRDRRGNEQPGREYIFNKGKPNEVRIRDDAGGHDFGPNDPQNRGPHFNDPQGNHYDY